MCCSLLAGFGLGFTLTSSNNLVFTYPCTSDITKSVGINDNEWVFVAVTYLAASTNGQALNGAINIEVSRLEQANWSCFNNSPCCTANKHSSHLELLFHKIYHLYSCNPATVFCFELSQRSALSLSASSICMQISHI